MSLTEQEQKQLRPQQLHDGPYVSYMVRRETHSSRAITSIVVAIIIIIAMVYLCVEGILGMMHHQPLLLSWTMMARNVAHLPHSIIMGALLAIGIICVLVGLVLLAKAMLPGALGRHCLKDQRVAYIVDDAVLASAVSRFTRREAGLGQGQVSTRVDRRSMTVDVIPTSGIPLSARTIEESLKPHVETFHLQPEPTIHVQVHHSGTVSK